MKFLSKKTHRSNKGNLENKYKSLRDREQSGLLDAAGRAELARIKAQLGTT